MLYPSILVFQTYLQKDIAANNLIEDTDLMVRLIQALNKAGLEKEERDMNIEKGYSTMQEEMVCIYISGAWCKIDYWTRSKFNRYNNEYYKSIIFYLA